MRRSSCLFLPLLLLVGTASAQHPGYGGVTGEVRLEVIDAQPVQPGTDITVRLHNDTGNFLGTGGNNDLVVMLNRGQLITPKVVGCSPVFFAIPPGTHQDVTISVPGPGLAGSAGSFILASPYRAATRLDVAVPDPAFAEVDGYPVGVLCAPSVQRAHHVAFPPAQVPDWEIANTSGSDVTIQIGTLSVIAPGGTTALTALDLAGTVIPARGAARVKLPLDGLPPGPYTVEMLWLDPSFNLHIRRRGITDAATPAQVDLHLPAGPIVPIGGSIPVEVRMQGFPISGLLQPKANIIYAVMLGFAPGVTPLPGGAILPLALDPLSIASVSGVLPTLIINGIGPARVTSVYCAHGLISVPEALPVSIAHHGLRRRNVSFRAAAIALDDMGNWGASQPEIITFR